MALQKLVLFKWNNYKNKICKGRPQISDGIEYTDRAGQTAIKFNPNDGINTSHILNINYNDFNYDYILEIENGTLVTRSWFITEVVRKQQGQVLVKLVRDIVTDYFESIKENQMMIFRGYCPDDNSAIYNKEGMQFNKIKKSETLLKDYSKTAWIIGYVPLGLTFQDQTLTFTSPELSNIESISSIEALPFYHKDKTVYIKNNAQAYAYMKFRNGSKVYDKTGLLMYGNGELISPVTLMSINYITTIGYDKRQENSQSIRNATEAFSNYYDTNIYQVVKGNDTHQLFWEDLLNLENKIYNDTSVGKYYKIRFIKERTQQFDYGNIVGNSFAQRVYNDVVNNLTIHEAVSELDLNKPVGTCRMAVDVYRFELEEVLNNQSYNVATNNFTNDTLHVNNQPYKMFAFPLDPTAIRYVLDDESVFENLGIAINSFLSTWTKDNGRILDLQVMPYFPEPGRFATYQGEDVIDIYQMPKFEIKDGNNQTVAIGLWIKEDSFRFFMNNSYQVYDKKVENETEVYRLTSPHYESMFEFNPVQMGGWTSLKIECTYKPYQPYVHVLPQYLIGSLYGDENFEDARGLVSNCNYSLPISSELWATFQRTNSTYQLTFDREIQNLEVEQNVQRAKEISGALLGGAVAGSKLGPAGIAVGGISSGLTAGFNEYARQEQMDYKRDIFSYNLQNIKAQPQTLTKVSGLDINNRLFPILEHYSCTQEEKLYFRNFLYYNGYRIERIGKLKDFVNSAQDYNYIEAEILRLEANIEAHELDYLSQTLRNGIYFAGGLFDE